MFAAGDDAAARQVVVGLLFESGWQDVIELEAIHNARGLGIWLPLWVRLMTAELNLKVVPEARPGRSPTRDEIAQ